ncbi:MAG: hypothetical protein GVY11_05510 [Gammaproteobacteria bacterium]|jgi:folate-binding protein YgfZ|nr:hypothetical protein [Gammaproteobacteria bacterium]
MSNHFSLDHLESFSLRGSDALAFAQSQFTVDVGQLRADTWSPLAWCDPKGRVLSVMIARAGENDVELIVPVSQGAGIRDRLRMFTIGRKVEITEARCAAGSFEPVQGDAALAFDSGRALSVGVRERSDPEALRLWQRRDLCGALPWLQPGNSGQHLPQWLGLEPLGALAYDKGCYPGQEVIARLHYRGTVKYHLAGMEVPATGAIDIHARITDDQDRAVGHWLDGMTSDGKTIGLAVIATRLEPGSEVVLPCGGRAQSAKVTTPESLC